MTVYASTPRSDRKLRGGGGYRSRQTMGVTPTAEWELPYGLRMPLGAYALRRQPAHGRVRHDLGAARARSR